MPTVKMFLFWPRMQSRLVNIGVAGNSESVSAIIFHLQSILPILLSYACVKIGFYVFNTVKKRQRVSAIDRATIDC